MRARTTVYLLVGLLAACAARQPQVRQMSGATLKPTEVSDDVERQFLADADRHATHADAIRGSGDAGQAQTEDRAAADGYSDFADRFSASEQRCTVRRAAAERYLLATVPDKAIEQTQKMLADSQCDPHLKAVATRLTASAWQAVALAETEAGKLEKLSLSTAAERQGKPPKPRALAEPWKRFVAAVDDYWPQAAQEVALKPDSSGRWVAGAPSAADLALVAAQVEYTYDNLEDAQGRLDRIIAAWPADATIMEVAVPMYLQTFLILGDGNGYDAAVRRVKQLLDPEAKKAQEAASIRDASSEQKKAAIILTRLGGELAQQQQGTEFSQGERFLLANKYAEAAEAFEQFAAHRRGHPDAPSALYNAALSWDKAQEPKKAAALREQLLKDFPNSKVAPQAVVAQASAASRREDHATAQKLYADYLKRWPQGEQRCLVLYNRGVELSSGGSSTEIANALVAFGTDDRCARGDPKAAARALYHAAGLYQKAKKAGKAKSALKSLLTLPPMNDPVVCSWIEDAQKRLSAMK